MQVKCEYCDQYYDSALPKCPNCGSPNDNLRRTADEVPQTIGELKAWFDSRGFTAEKTRFFIGEDYRKPKAFGIYKDAGGKCVVYKNKANGERAVRYEGYDEKYAVNELYERMQSEIVNQKSHYVEKKKALAIDEVRRTNEEVTRKRRGSGVRRFFVTIFVILGISSVIYQVGKRLGFYVGNRYDNGYYTYEDETYYSLDDHWYYYDPLEEYWWPAETIPEDLGNGAADYYQSSYYTPDIGAMDFTETDYYSNWEYDQTHSSSYDDDYDDYDDWDSDWGSDDWDSGDTDWDSDW